MLSDHEQRVLDDIELFWPETAEEPVDAGMLRPHHWESDLDEATDLPFAVVAGVWITVALVLLGAPLAGLVVGAATAAGWAWWRSRPHPPPEGGRTRLPTSGE